MGCPGAVGQSGPRDVWIRGRVSTRKLGDLCASALSLQDYPMPPRTIQESYRLRVSDRTMVANFATRSGLLVSRKLEWRRRRQWAAMKPTGNDENSSGRFSPGQTQSGSRQSAQLNGKRGWMAPRTSAVSGGRRRILLTSLFIGLPSDQLGVVNTPFPTNVYDLVGILREWPGPATEVTCSRQAWAPGL